MPLPSGTRYRWKTFPSGAKVRLAFDKGGDVIEAKSGQTGATHTPSEFAADRKKAKGRRGSKRKKEWTVASMLMDRYPSKKV